MSDAMVSAAYYLVLAIGLQKLDEETAQLYFDYARDQAFNDPSGNLGVGTVQAFILITIYMLGACQINGAFLFFGIAVRAAYSIGLHRSEVNSRFGPEIHRQRDVLWKSLRVVDLFLSTSMWAACQPRRMSTAASRTEIRMRTGRKRSTSLTHPPRSSSSSRV